jgi:hypothetical protein
MASRQKAMQGRHSKRCGLHCLELHKAARCYRGKGLTQAGTTKALSATALNTAASPRWRVTKARATARSRMSLAGPRATSTGSV